ncbi:MAG: LysR family transcriptional regulator, partial [Methanomassiliicoccaceae archaeon]|nr:LysR family transcriptional regulator [Methanomassiliicoccaceae archaeon]
MLNAVNETGSINAAAKVLNITPPVAYRHIREAE